MKEIAVTFYISCNESVKNIFNDFSYPEPDKA